MDDTLRHAPIGIVEVATDGTVLAANEAAVSVLDADTGVGPDSNSIPESGGMAGATITEVFPKSTDRTLHDAFEGGEGVPAARSFEEYYPRIDRWLEVDIVPESERVLIYVRDRSERRETRRRVERLQRRLDRTGSIDDIVATVLRTVIDADGREEVAQTVCDRLGSAALYEFVWVGERDLASDRLTVVAAAGEAPEMRDRIADHLGTADALPEQAAVATAKTRVVQSIAADDDIPRPVRLAAFGHGLQSCLAVPLAHRGTVYGVLGVYAAREEGFDERERTSLETLGSVAGFAINAIRQEDLLFADTITELTVEVRDPAVPFVDAAASADCELRLEGAVPRDDGAVVCYVRPERAPETVREALSTHDGVAAVRRVESDDAAALLEAELTGTAPVATLAARGVSIREALYSDGVATVAAEVPSETDLRQLVGAVDAAVAETEVVSKRERQRDAETVGAFRDELEETLTDKQRRVLRTAYLSDYFTSPRGSTSEEVAEALDITGPTVLYHLRRAQRKLLRAFFERDPQ